MNKILANRIIDRSVTMGQLLNRSVNKLKEVSSETRRQSYIEHDININYGAYNTLNASHKSLESMISELELLRTDIRMYYKEGINTYFSEDAIAENNDLRNLKMERHDLLKRIKYLEANQKETQEKYIQVTKDIPTKTYDYKELESIHLKLEKESRLIKTRLSKEITKNTHLKKTVENTKNVSVYNPDDENIIYMKDYEINQAAGTVLIEFTMQETDRLSRMVTIAKG